MMISSFSSTRWKQYKYLSLQSTEIMEILREINSIKSICLKGILRLALWLFLIRHRTGMRVMVQGWHKWWHSQWRSLAFFEKVSYLKIFSPSDYLKRMIISSKSQLNKVLKKECGLCSYLQEQNKCSDRSMEV